MLPIDQEAADLDTELGDWLDAVYQKDFTVHEEYEEYWRNI